jgi:hypothetical protein
MDLRTSIFWLKLLLVEILRAYLGREETCQTRNEKKKKRKKEKRKERKFDILLQFEQHTKKERPVFWELTVAKSSL